MSSPHAHSHTTTGSLMMDSMHDDDPFGASLSQSFFGTSTVFDDLPDTSGTSDSLYGTSSRSLLLSGGGGTVVSGIPSSPPITPMKGLGVVPLLPPPCSLGGAHSPASLSTQQEQQNGVYSSRSGVHVNNQVAAAAAAVAGNVGATRQARRRSPSPSESGSTDSEDFFSDVDSSCSLSPIPSPTSTTAANGGCTQRTPHQQHIHATVTRTNPHHVSVVPPPPMYVGATHEPKKQMMTLIKGEVAARPPPPLKKQRSQQQQQPMNPEQHAAPTTGTDAFNTGLPVASFTAMSSVSNTFGALSMSGNGGDSDTGGSDGTFADADAYDTPMTMSSSATLTAPVTMNTGGFHPRPPPPPATTGGAHQQQQQQFGGGNTSAATFSQSIGAMGRSMSSNSVMPMGDASSTLMVPPQLSFAPTHTMSGGAGAASGGGAGDATSPSMSLGPGMSPTTTTTNVDGMHVVGGTGRIETEVVRKRRLARKAELARSSRRKKKQRLNDLEGEVSQLQEELDQAQHQRKHDLEIIAELRAQNAAIQAQAAAHAAAASHAAAAAQRHESTKLDVDMRSAMKAITSVPLNTVQGAATSARLTSLIKEFCAKLKQMGAGVDTYVEHLVDTPLMPLPVRFLEWAMSQNDAFFESKDQLWSQLFAQIGYSQQQMETLLSFRERMKEQRTSHKEVNAHTEALRAKQRALYASAVENFDEIRGVFTERQLAQFFAWCESNELCVNALMSASS